MKILVSLICLVHLVTAQLEKPNSVTQNSLDAQDDGYTLAGGDVNPIGTEQPINNPGLTTQPVGFSKGTPAPLPAQVKSGGPLPIAHPNPGFSLAIEDDKDHGLHISIPGELGLRRPLDPNFDDSELPTNKFVKKPNEMHLMPVPIDAEGKGKEKKRSYPW